MKKKLSHPERGRKGGLKTKERFGNDFYKRIGKIGGKQKYIGKKQAAGSYEKT